MTVNVKDRYSSTLESDVTAKVDPARPYQESTTVETKINYSELVKTPEFVGLLKKKKAFLVPATVFFLTFYFLLPILAANTDILNTEAFFGMTWAWVYALSQFAVVWIGGLVYMWNASKYDITVKEILTKHKKELER